MATNFTNAAIFLIHTFFGLFLILVLVRFLMQISRADYYNPICQVVVKLTNPAINPLKKILPSIGNIDFATLFFALMLQVISISLVMLIAGNLFFEPIYIGWALVGLASTILDIYFFTLIAMVIVSWISPYSNHPAISLISQITDPICKPARKLIPPMGGLDFSIILVFVVITLVDNFLIIRPLAISLGIPSGLVLGLN